MQETQITTMIKHDIGTIRDEATLYGRAKIDIRGNPRPELEGKINYNIDTEFWSYVAKHREKKVRITLGEWLFNAITEIELLEEKEAKERKQI